jgi:hypothetical protein
MEFDSNSAAQELADQPKPDKIVPVSIQSENYAVIYVECNFVLAEMDEWFRLCKYHEHLAFGCFRDSEMTSRVLGLWDPIVSGRWQY